VANAVFRATGKPFLSRAQEDMGIGAGTIGLIVSAAGVGGLIGSLGISRFIGPRRWPFTLAAVRIRQIVTRSGARSPSPSALRWSGPTSAAPSAIAAYERAPARTAHTAAPSTAVNPYRRPRR
jgi:hypothetical protein